jgi:hypothetical protein
MAKQKRKPTAGSFRKGPDPRRYRFTPSDCRVGWLVANILHPELREWLRTRLRCYYHRKEKAHGQKEGHAGPGGDPA